ncbi:AraC family transcriptional regulator [Bacillaceae bacterium SAS-127]|nr:AraC family transcriptional regulator [Bacillaceae bacterium SAS-127]
MREIQLDIEGNDKNLEALSFKFRSIDFMKGAENCQLKQQLVFSYALIIVTNGEIELSLDVQTYRLEKNTLFLCKPNETFVTAAMTESVEMYVVYFDVYEENQSGRSLTVMMDAKPLPYSGKISLPEDEKLLAICSSLYKGWHSQRRLSSLHCELMCLRLIYYIHHMAQMKPDHTCSAIDRAKQYIEVHYMENLTIARLAQMAELSPKYFGDLFKKKFGKSVMKYVSELRMQEAKRLMATAQLPIRDIAHQVGYSDEFYFSRKFKQEVGESPSMYIKNRGRKMIAYHPSVIGYLLPLNIFPLVAPLHPKWTPHYYQHYRQDIPLHLNAYRRSVHESNIEAIKQAGAQIIIAFDDISVYEKQQLEEIAPVYYISMKQTWQKQFLLLAEFLGEREQAENWMQKFECQLQEVKDQYTKQLSNQSVAIIKMREQHLYAHYAKGISELLYEQLHLQPTYDKCMNNEIVTLAELNEQNPDHLFMLIRQENYTLANWERLKNNREWQRLSAVHQNQLYHLPSDPCLEHSPYAYMRMLELLQTFLPVNSP